MPRSKKSSSKSDRITEEDLDAAVRVIRADYYQEVRGIAEELEAEVKKGDITSEDQLEERLRQDIDGSARVIYTFRNHLGLLASDNSDAYMEEFGDVPVSGNAIDYAALMAAAMMADVREVLPSFDFDE